MSGRLRCGASLVICVRVVRHRTLSFEDGTFQNDQHAMAQGNSQPLAQVIALDECDPESFNAAFRGCVWKST